MASERRKWSREETILALDLYFKIPFEKVKSYHPDVVKLARFLNRPPASLSMKIGNIGRLDPTLAARGIVGLSHGAKNEKQVWNEFYGRCDLLAEESYRIRQGLGSDADATWDDESIKTPAGLDGVRLFHYRINQSFFRSSILAAYEDTCCVTGLSDRRLLIASHIKPWAKCEDGNERTDPQNGLCLSPLFDKVFDKGLMTIDDDYTIKYSQRLRDNIEERVWQEQFAPYERKKIRMPARGMPLREHLEYHHKYIFLV